MLFTASGLPWQAVLKKGKSKIESFNCYRHVYNIYQYVKANNKYIRDYDKKKNLSYLEYWDVNNFYR